METDRKIQPIYHYPIDDYPIDINEFIKPYDACLNEVKDDDNLYSILYWGLFGYRTNIMYNADFSVNPELFSTALFFLANTGYDCAHYFPNDFIWEKIDQAPDLAITDLDKAILGCIYNCALMLSTAESSADERNYKEFLYSYIYFFHNAQKYEQKTKRTIEISLEKEAPASILIEILTNPSYTEVDSNMICLSETDIDNLTNVLSYREELNSLIAETRINEKNYILNDENESDWELFISCINYRASEEKRVTELINSDIPISQKLFEFNMYFEEIDLVPKVFNSKLNLGELLERIVKRAELAPNYLWVKADDIIIDLNNEQITSISSPYSFNCILIAYHAFLIKMSPENITRLIFTLNIFIRKNLGKKLVKREDFGNIDSLEQSLVSISNIILSFHEKHKEAIDSIRYDSIQNDETLSGFSFYGDIFRRVYYTERKMFNENMHATKEMHDEVVEYFDELAELLMNNASDDEIYRFQCEFRSKLPNKLDDEKKLVNHEIGNRLIVSINAIYILVKVMDRLLDKGLIRKEYRHSIVDYSKRLTKLEKHLVRTTYVSPDYNCFDDVDMDEYRERKGIDASVVELKNKELREITLFDSARRIIRTLHEEINNLDYEKAMEIKNQLRDEIKESDDSRLKDFIVELVDQESLFICKTLTSHNSGTNEYIRIRKSLCDDLGTSSKHLPEKAVDALATAELLYLKYATPEYSEVNFDYSCISVLYYQAVEIIYNDLLWKEYAEELYKKRCNDSWFLIQYRDNLLLEKDKIYLPVDGQFKYWDKEKRRITDHLMMGSFIILFKAITSTTDKPLKGFREYVDKVFGYEPGKYTADEYAIYQKKINELYSLFEEAKPRRNAASHGESPISFEECKADKKLVLSDVESVRKGILGIIKLFLSLYKEKEP